MGGAGDDDQDSCLAAGRLKNGAGGVPVPRERKCKGAGWEPGPAPSKRSDTVYSFQIDQHTDTYETDKLNAMYEWSITPWWQKAIIKVRHFVDTICGMFKREEDIPF